MQKSILITGCSSGIGLATAQALKQRGHRVFATARKEEDVKKLKELGLESILLDVNDPQSIQIAIQAILEATRGTLDVLFNNAGYVVPGAVEDLSRDMMRAQFETNVFGAMELVNQVLPVMHQQGYGRIIQNTSILGLIAMPYRGAYNASKFALEGFSQTLRQELRGTPIRVSIIVPGPIETHLRENAFNVYKKTLRGKKSLYAGIYQAMENYFFTPPQGRRLTLPSSAVAKKIIHAVESKQPKLRYYVGLPAYSFSFLRRILPENLLDWIIEKIAKEEADA